VTLTAAGEAAAGEAERILGDPPPSVRVLNADDLSALDRSSRHFSPGTLTTDPGESITLRAVPFHLIEETARHGGHLDALRERAGGATGR
jgi:hypothetical protein